MRSDEAGWVLLEAVALGMIVLATVAAVGIFARTALLREHAASRMEAALLARAQISVMEAALDQGTPPAGGTTEVSSNRIPYHVETEVVRAAEFYDVRMRISWQILGRRAQTEYVRRLRQHVRTVEPTSTP